MDTSLQDSEEEIKPLKRRRKQRKSTKNYPTYTVADIEVKSKNSRNINKLLQISPKTDAVETKHFIKKQQKVNTQAMSSSSSQSETKPKTESPKKLQDEHSKGMFCSRNNKPDMQYFQPRKEPEKNVVQSFHCPVCNINLNFLHGKSPQAHINECLDINPEFEKGIM